MKSWNWHPISQSFQQLHNTHSSPSPWPTVALNSVTLLFHFSVLDLPCLQLNHNHQCLVLFLFEFMSPFLCSHNNLALPALPLFPALIHSLLLCLLALSLLFYLDSLSLTIITTQFSQTKKQKIKSLLGALGFVGLQNTYKEKALGDIPWMMNLRYIYIYIYEIISHPLGFSTLWA